MLYTSILSCFHNVFRVDFVKVETGGVIEG